MSAAPPAPQRPAPAAELVSRAWTEALAMTSADPHPGPCSGSDGRADPGCPGPGELAAHALRAHSALAQGLGRCIPVTGLSPGGGGEVRALAAFLAVYAAHDEHPAPTPDTPS